MRLRNILTYSVAITLGTGFAATEAAALPDKDSTAIVSTINRFHMALESADTAAVKAILANDVIVLESGYLETRSDYLAHHLGADIEFAKAIQSPRKIAALVRNGNSAWVTSTSTTAGTFKGRAINSQGTELMVLTRAGSSWKIRAIHWSSARKQTETPATAK